MKEKRVNKPQSNASSEGGATYALSVTQLLSVSPVLPGESADLYRTSLQSLINELEAKTVLQVYLAEKIHECLWWMRRYEQQKRLTLIHEMASLSNPLRRADREDRQAHLLECLRADNIDSEALNAIATIGHTIDSLLQKALENKRSEITYLNNQIALQAKILAGFQASYEVAFNRKFNTERLRLQNEMMTRDLLAIDAK